MNSAKENIQISKFLSLVLRHQPETIGITLDENGWTSVNTLLDKMQAAGIMINLDLLKEIVHTNSKQRFAFNEDASKIRANQGHSVSVELAYEPNEPPAILYHGTREVAIPYILKEGLQKQRRHHVHLSADQQTALTVGGRHGKPVVFTIASGDMYKDGYTFYVSTNGVWLTDHVPTKYLLLLDNK